MEKSESYQPYKGQEKSLNERKRFVFLGGNIALDLVNTVHMLRGKRVDVLQTPQDVALWWEMAQQVYPQLIKEQEHTDWNEQQVSTLRTLREVLRLLFELLAIQHQVNENAVKELNAFLREGHYALKVSQTGKVSAVYQAHPGKENMVVVTIAYAAMSLLTEHDRSRLRACQNSRCILLFYDTSKSATRHWCSIACTNRARSRQYYKRAKEASLL